ncbi:hypothetical protein LZ554_003224 [Drepanopeziza brunnea f. sp. 'monogermtubi']|nr:hypothetical protein LZ554_003224 [Drepanopeziza brunnea f. sp. 'monogermtubi']
MENLIAERRRILKLGPDDAGPAWINYRYPRVDEATGKCADNEQLKKPDLDRSLEETTAALRRAQYPAQVTPVTPMVPDIGPNTIIVAACGTTGQDALPHQAGGFITADFLLAYQLWAGATTDQVWLHSINFPALLKTNHRYVHGSPYGTRKVVMDERLFEESRKGVAKFPLETFLRDSNEKSNEQFQEE